MYSVRTAVMGDLSVVERIAKANQDSLGFTYRFILKAAIEYKALFVACKEDSEVVGYMRWERGLDGWDTVHEICVRRDFRREGIGKLLLSQMPGPLRLSCLVIAESNSFFKHLGFASSGEVCGRNIWLLFRKKGTCAALQPLS